MTSATGAASNASIEHVFEARPIDSRWSLLYLAAPAVVFLASFIQPLVGLGTGFLLIGALVTVLWGQRATQRTSATILAPMFVAILLTWLAGFPQGPYAWDWIKHWALANELASHDWPLVLELQGSSRHVRFYLGAYLVPTLLHKILPFVGVPLALGAWFFTGYALVLRTVSTVASDRRTVWIALSLLLSLGGADMLAEHAYRAIRGLPVGPWIGLHYESWAFNAFGAPVEFSSMITALLWVPHQSIATFIVAALLIFQRGPSAFGAAMLGFGLLAIWSPYGMIGLFPLMLMVAWDRKAELAKWNVLLCALSGAVFAVVVIAYLSTELPGAGACFQCLPGRLLSLWDFVPFWIIELVAFALILRQRIVQDLACLISLATLLVLPLLHGQTPDLVMRGSMGPLFVLSVRSVQVLLEWKGVPWQKALQIAAICACLPSAVSEAVYQRQGGTAHLAFPRSDPLGARWMKTFAVRNDYTASEFFEICGWEYVQQYFSIQKPRLVKDAGSDNRLRS